MGRSHRKSKRGAPTIKSTVTSTSSASTTIETSATNNTRNEIHKPQEEKQCSFQSLSIPCCESDVKIAVSKVTNAKSTSSEAEERSTPKAAENSLSETASTCPIERPRNVFLSTSCHFCKGVSAHNNSKTTLLQLCSSCRLVKYCCKDHQKHDWKSHKELCKLVGAYMKIHNMKDLYQEVHAQNLSEAGWLQMRYNFMELFRSELNRELSSFEKEILLFPNLCVVCRRTSNSEFGDLKTCEKCRGVSFCPQHYEKEHKHCDSIKVWIDIVRWEHNYGLVKPDLSKIVSIPEEQLNCTDAVKLFPTNIQNYFSRNSTAMASFRSVENGQATLNDADYQVLLSKLTDIATIPLTIMHGLIKSQDYQSAKQVKIEQVKTLRIHLIGAEAEFEGLCSYKWETFFIHLFPLCKLITIVLVGPEIEHAREDLKLCHKCTVEKRKISIECRKQYYHEYCKQRTYIAPNILCALNCGLYRTTGFVGNNMTSYDEGQQDSWKPTLIRFMNSDDSETSSAPAIILITEYTQTEIEQNSKRIQRDCQHLNEIPELRCRNPFRSLRPQRALINDYNEPLMYKNNFMSVYTMMK